MMALLPADSRLYATAQLVAVLLTAICLVGWQFHKTQILRETRVSLDNYIDGNAHKPFAFRVLVPGIMRSLNSISPSAILQRLDQTGQRLTFIFNPIPAPYRISSGPDEKYPRALVWLAAIGLISLVAYAYLSRSFYRSVFPGCKYDRLVPLAALAIVGGVLHSGFSHVYDLPLLALFSCLYWLMATGRHYAYLIVFALACLNKETTIFVTLAWAAVYFGRLPISQYVSLLALQLGLFLVIYAGVRIAFGENAGLPIEYYLHLQPRYYLTQPASYYISLGVTLFLITFRWKEKPEFFKRAIIMLLPFLALVLYGAAPGEVRNLYEGLPLLLPLMVRNGAIIASQWRAPGASG